MAVYDLNMQEIRNKIDRLNTTSKRSPELNRMRLSEEELEEVAGGLWRKQGYSKAFWVECPQCGCNLRRDITGWKNDLMESDYFYCSKCGKVWGLTKDGYLCV